MKLVPIYFLSVLFSTGAFISCQKEKPIEPVAVDNCVTVISTWKQANQALANQLCDTVWGDLDCIHD